MLKPRVEEAVARATTINKERFPVDRLEETCENALDTVELLRFRSQKFNDAHSRFRSIAETSEEDNTHYQKSKAVTERLIQDAEDIARQLDRKVRRNIKSFAERHEEEKTKMAHDLALKQQEYETLKLDSHTQLEKQAQEAAQAKANSEIELQKHNQALDSHLQELKLNLEKEKERNTQSTSRNEETQRPRSSQTSFVRLEKLEIPKFSGNVLKWREFWDSFESAIDQRESLSDVDKLNYLRSKLEGQALTIVSGLGLSHDKYRVAVGLLKARYADPERIVEAHYSQLQKLYVNSSHPFQLRNFVDNFELHLRSLEAMDENVETQQMLTLLRSRLPADVLFELDMRKCEGRWTLTHFREALGIYLRAQESSRSAREQGSQPWTFRSNDRRPFAPNSNRRPEIKRDFSTRSGPNPFKSFAAQVKGVRPLMGSVSSAPRAFVGSFSDPSCVYCNGKHYSDQCTQFSTVAARKQRLNGRCFKCLSESHRVVKCPSTKSCVYCKQKSHHRSLCTSRVQSASRPNQTSRSGTLHASHDSEAQTSDQNTSSISLSHPETTTRL